MVVINAILWVVVNAVMVIIILIGIATCLAMAIMTIQYAWYLPIMIFRDIFPKRHDHEDDQTTIEDHSCHCGLPFRRNTEITIIIKKEN